MANVLLFSLIVGGQWMAYAGSRTLAAGSPLGLVLGRAAPISAVSLILGEAVVTLIGLFRIFAMPAGRQVGVTLVVSLFAALSRAFVVARIDDLPLPGVGFVNLWVVGLVGYAVAVIPATAVTRMLHHQAELDAARIEEARLAARAVMAVEEEQLRVRRDVATQLHGSLQHQLTVRTPGGVHAWAEPPGDLTHVNVREGRCLPHVRIATSTVSPGPPDHARPQTSGEAPAEQLVTRKPTSACQSDHASTTRRNRPGGEHRGGVPHEPVRGRYLALPLDTEASLISRTPLYRLGFEAGGHQGDELHCQRTVPRCVSPHRGRVRRCAG